MSLELLEPDSRIALAPVRAAAWAGWMTAEQFAERNVRLYAHELSATRCHAYGWRQDGDIVSSMELYDVRLGISDGRGGWSEEPAVLIASVVTPSEKRGRGYAGAMLEEYFRRNPSQNSVLYSDIGPPFYERFGFRAFPRYSTERAPGELVDSPARPISPEKFTQRLAERRRQLVLAAGVPGAALLPDAQWLDWYVERFRYFAEIADTPFFDRLFWKLDHGGEHLLAFVPHYPLRKLEALWVDTGCDECLAFGAGLAAEWGLTAFRYWSPRRLSPKDKEECPMLRVPRLGTAAVYQNVQFVDWW